jgi:7,8-dihydropterin-6-yl-methyl-4-(beta-D-ribofuranosyl)aminobenzene 5'-phosphate synthase
MRHLALIFLITTVSVLLLARVAAAQGQNRVTILYDAFGKPSSLQKDWGFAALIEYDGKRILFDTGNNADTFAHNVKALKIDLKRLDFVVISHRHGDHTSGLNYLLTVNPGVKIYVPKETYGVFGSSLPGTFYRRAESLSPDMRYFGGAPPETVRHGTPWTHANFIYVDSLTEVAPNIYLIATVSQTPGTLELRELSLAIKTSKGLILTTGCSHPGIEKIVEASMAVDNHVHLIFGGLHLVTTPQPEVDRIVVALHEKWKVDRIAPGHCTGEPAFAALQQLFGERYLYAGLGTILELP